MNYTVKNITRRNRTQRILSLFFCFALIGFTGCGKGKKSIPGVEKFDVSIIQSQIYASFVSSVLKMDQGLTAPIPGLKDATLTIGPDFASEGTVFQFSIPLSSLANKGRSLPLMSLPDGRPIPDILGGELPRWDVNVVGVSLNLFLSREVFGLFVPLKLLSKKGISLPITLSTSIKDSKGNRIGKVYALGSKKPEDITGLLLLLPITKGGLE